MLWEPAIYEHKAKLIGKPVWDVANSATLLAEAMRVEHEVYRADFLTVGVDVYNVEAEACGAAVVADRADSCPEIPLPPWSLDALPSELDLPCTRNSGRFPMIREAAGRVCDVLRGAECVPRVAASGPVSIAAKLVGAQELLIGLALGQPEAQRILEFATALACCWCETLRAAGLNAVLFDSSCAPPMVSPAMYRSAVRPCHARILDLLNGSGQNDRPLIIGGDTTEIVRDMIAAGATSVICDFTADAARFAARLGGCRGITVRRNVDPAVLSRSADAIAVAGTALARDLSHFQSPVAGTGVLPYHTDPAAYWLLHRAATDG